MAHISKSMTADGTGVEFTHKANRMPGVYFCALGIWDGASVKVQQRHSDNVWRTVQSYTADASVTVNVASGTRVRAVVENAGVATDLFLEFADLEGR